MRKLHQLAVAPISQGLQRFREGRRLRLQRVGKLTAPTPVRRNCDSGSPRTCGWLPLAICVLTPGLSPAADWQAIEEIVAVAEDFLGGSKTDGDRQIAARARGLDPRLRLPRCDQPLQAFVRDTRRSSSRQVVGVRCEGSRPWKIYVPVELQISASVLVAKRSMQRGQVPGPGDLVVERRDVGRLHSGYLSDPAEIVDRPLKHRLLAGQVLTPAMLQAELLVRRGQSVTLLVSDAGVDIRMSGTALMDGIRGQRIRVRNASSDRIVEGLVRSAEIVEVLVD